MRPPPFHISMSSINTRNPNPVPIGIKFGFLKYGGGRWIRTTEGIASRFTVCPLWPLGNSPMYSLFALLSEAVELVDGLEPPTC